MAHAGLLASLLCGPRGGGRSGGKGQRASSPSASPAVPVPFLVRGFQCWDLTFVTNAHCDPRYGMTLLFSRCVLPAPKKEVRFRESLSAHIMCGRQGRGCGPWAQGPRGGAARTPGVDDAGGLRVWARAETGRERPPSLARPRSPVKVGSPGLGEDVHEESTSGGDRVWPDFRCFDYSHSHQS